MTQYVVSFSAKDRIISIVFLAFSGAVLFIGIKEIYRSLTVLNCQPRLQQVICKVHGAENKVLEISKTQLSRVETIEGRSSNKRITQRTVLITTDNQEIPLDNLFNKERFNEFINDPSAKTLTIDPSQNVTIAAAAYTGFVSLILFIVFKNAWIDPSTKIKSRL
jgi:hypothetical protein